MSKDKWMLVSFICAAWVFLGLAALALASQAKSVTWGIVIGVSWVLNWILLYHANRRWP